MKKTFIFMSIVLLTFSFIFIGCGDDKADPALNGTWVDGDEKIKFDNGDFSIYGDNVEFVRGTYETDDGKITMTATEVNPVFYLGLEAGIGIDDKLYTRADLKTISNTLVLSGVVTSAEVDEYLDEMFSTRTAKYSIDGNKLTLTDEGGSKSTFTKQ